LVKQTLELIFPLAHLGKVPLGIFGESLYPRLERKSCSAVLRQILMQAEVNETGGQTVGNINSVRFTQK